MEPEMALSLSSDPAGRRGQQYLTPTATEFTPQTIEPKEDVLDSSFITQTVPNAHRFAGIIGLCTVAEDEADMNKLGWHIADFLAFKILLCGDNPPKAQTWLAMCDIPALVEADPERYTHGKEKRLVGSAARPRLVDREDNIQVETLAENLKEKFILAVKEKLAIAERGKYPLMLIICGPTSPQQDIYFGKLDVRYTLEDLRHELGDRIDRVDATVITPSLFSAGWRVNTSFGRLNSTGLSGSRADFLARQSGGLFSQDIVKGFLGWKCPALDEERVDPLIRTSERFPGPLRQSDEVKALTSQIQTKIQSRLIGGLSSNPTDHSFSFDGGTDEWEILVGLRERAVDYHGLDYYRQKWEKLPFAQRDSKTSDEGLSFLGNVFGGTKVSQLNHIRYLLEESYLAWPDYWVSSFGQETRKDFERVVVTEQLDELSLHEVFNVLEHRASMSILADTIVRYFDFPAPYNKRCRDWDQSKWKQELTEADRSSLIKYFGTVLGCVPGPNVPPGVNLNSLSRLQRRLECGASYVRAALGIRFLTATHRSKDAVNCIDNCK
ncbi:hypothetical protein F5Y14DRAFT_343692 [Nemania sp. NC0429]|nr:hypothetical protein F5Y14DRAFT_343692 [Nemania sp. NC0429]